MLKRDGVLLVFIAGLLGGMLSGCVQYGRMSIYVPDRSDEDCGFCHAPTNAANFQSVGYARKDLNAHHPVNIVYPPETDFENNYLLPGSRLGSTAYFDHNNDSKLNDNEIRLFVDKNGVKKIVCSTCHRDHGDMVTLVEHPDDDFLRGTNGEGEFCLHCHRIPPRRIVPNTF